MPFLTVSVLVGRVPLLKIGTLILSSLLEDLVNFLHEPGESLTGNNKRWLIGVIPRFPHQHSPNQTRSWGPQVDSRCHNSLVGAG